MRNLTPLYYSISFLKCNTGGCTFLEYGNEKVVVLVILTVMATIGLTGQIVPGLTVFADESDMDTEQKIKQKNVSSGFAICSNIADNLIESGILR
jgi:hypothetical protein